MPDNLTGSPLREVWQDIVWASYGDCPMSRNDGVWLATGAVVWGITPG